MGGSINNWETTSSSVLRELTKAVINNLDNNLSSSDTEDLYKDLLKTYNDRNTDKINNVLDEIKDTLKDIIDGTIDLNFGGSVAKHTYVDGISDIDCLLKINRDSDFKPDDCLDTIYNTLKDKYSAKKGCMAITISIKDIGDIQIVPAKVNGDKIQVREWEKNEWSKINPTKFTDKLTECNKVLNNNLIPTIKLTKAINATLPEELRLSGYHIESLAINAFKNYTDSCTLVKMLPHLIKEIATGVRTPIVDKTGQSRHVDDTLGAANSTIREKISHMYDNISQQINDAKSLDKLREIIEGND